MMGNVREHCAEADTCLRENCDECPEWRDSHVRVSKDARTLSCKLSGKELNVKASLLVRAMTEIEELEDERKGIIDEYKGKISEVQGRVTKLKAVIQSGSEQRDVACRIVKDFKEGEILVIRLDTEEVIDKTPMKSEQQDMHFVTESPAEEKPEAEKTPEDADPPEEVVEPEVEEEPDAISDMVEDLEVPE